SIPHFNSPALDAGASYPGQLTATVPRGISGKYYIYVVADSFGNVYQVGQRDFRQHLGSTSLDVNYAEPAFQISNVSAPASVQAGEHIQVGWTVTNVGSRATREFFWPDRVFLSRDPSLGLYTDNRNTPEVVCLGSTFHGQPLGIDPSNNSYDTQLDVSIPDGLQGDFYIVVFTDAVDLLFANEITNTVKEFAGEGRHIMAEPTHI